MICQTSNHRNPFRRFQILNQHVRLRPLYHSPLASTIVHILLFEKFIPQVLSFIWVPIYCSIHPCCHLLYLFVAFFVGKVAMRIVAQFFCHDLSIGISVSSMYSLILPYCVIYLLILPMPETIPIRGADFLFSLRQHHLKITFDVLCPLRTPNFVSKMLIFMG